MPDLPASEANVMIAFLARLDSIDRRLAALETNAERDRIADLVEAALKAVATESKNAVDIQDLKARLSLVERRLPLAG